MYLRVLILLLFLQLIPDGGSKEGRRGNEMYEKGQYEEAVAQYRSGLDAISGDNAGPTRYGLLNNLGAALHRSSDFENAKKSFTEAMAAARSEADFSRSAYNAGNNAYAVQDLQGALDFYEKALLANPNNEDAKYNYEFVKRQLQNQQQQQKQSGDQSENQEQNQQQQDQSDQNSENQQNNPQSQNQEQENQDQQQSGQSQPDPGEEEQNQQQQQQPRPDQDQLSRAEAERILQALQNEEENLLRETRKLKTRPRSVEKDW